MQDKNQLIEQLSEIVHDSWMEEKKKQGFHSPIDCKEKKEWGGKFTRKCSKCHTDMYPYFELPDNVQNYDRVTVKGVIKALYEAILKRDTSDSGIIETTKIGAQIWMKKNLSTEKYRNGDIIPQVQNTKEWEKLRTGAWCYYGNNSENGKTYGKLYNWYAVNDSRGLAPDGWHIPSDKEWTKFTDYLGGDMVASGKMKEAGTSHWDSPNTGADNSSGFTALPGGGRYADGSFLTLGYVGYWWSATEYGATYAWLRYLYYGSAVSSRYFYSKGYGFSVRCLRDL